MGCMKFAIVKWCTAHMIGVALQSRITDILNIGFKKVAFELGFLAFKAAPFCVCASRSLSIWQLAWCPVHTISGAELNDSPHPCPNSLHSGQRCWKERYLLQNFNKQLKSGEKYLLKIYHEHNWRGESMIQEHGLLLTRKELDTKMFCFISFDLRKPS